MREQSFQTHSKKISEEEWIPVCYQKTSSSSAEVKNQTKFLWQHTKNNILLFSDFIIAG